MKSYTNLPKSKHITFLLMLSLICLSTTIANAEEAFQQDEGIYGIVSMEAENFDDNIPQGDHAWNLIVSPGGFSGTAAMRAEPDTGAYINTGYVNSSPRLDYKVNFVKTGTHYIWVRVYKTSDDDESCHAGLDGGAVDTADRITNLGSNNQWLWTSITKDDSSRPQFDIEYPGIRTVNIWMREDGFRIDKIVLTTNPGYTPTGDGPDESSRSAPINYSKGDLNEDYRVNFEDLEIFTEQWLDDTDCSEEPNCADLDDTNEVTMSDFALLAENWFKGCGEPTLVINEFMAANGSCIADPQNEFDDWIEIYNPSAVAINIGGMYITDDLNEPTKWQIPDDSPGDTNIPPHQYLMLWADGDTDDGALHLDFKLSKDKEDIGLYWSDGNMVDSISFKNQVSNLSYGCYPDATNNWRYMGNPTPGMQNSEGYLGLVDEVDISHLRGFYDSAFEVELSCDTNDAVIYYTVDGSEPDEATSPAYDPDVRVPITGTTCLRAAAFKPGYKSSRFNTCTYIFIDEVRNQDDSYAYSKGFPSQWTNRWGTSYDSDYEMDPEVLDDPGWSGRFETAMKAIPTMSIVTDMANLFDSQTGIYSNPYEYHEPENGEDWERAISLEYFDPCTGEDFQINAGLRLAGNQSRQPELNHKHSMRIFFKSEFGPSMLEYPFYENSDAKKHNNISLRANYHWSWLDASEQFTHRAQYLRDTFAQDSVRDMGYLSPDSKFVHVYINGIYWGLYQASERPDGPFFAEHTGGEREDYDVIEGTIEGTGGITCKEGQRDSWDYMWGLFDPYDYYSPMNATDYAELAQHVDITQFCDYIIYNTFVTNWDWNSKNWYAASLRDPQDVDGPPLDKWKFYPWDSEISMWEDTMFHDFPFSGYYNEGAGLMHNALHNNPEYNRLLGDRIHKLLFNDGTMTVQKCIDRYEARAEEIEDAVLGESARWGDYVQDFKDAGFPVFTPAYWDNERDRMINPDHPIEEGWIGPYLPDRTGWLIDNGYPSRGFYPSVDAPAFSQHGGEIAAGASVTITGGGTIYYTTDGSEPVVYGTTISSGSSVTINHSLTLKARARYGGDNWSALNEATFAVGSVVDDLRITEIMYHPPGVDGVDYNDPNHEFIELKNIGTGTLNLNLVSFNEGIHLTFPNKSLAPGEHILVVKNETAFEAKYGVGKNIAGEWTGPFGGILSNGGERIRVVDAIGRTILDFSYKDGWRRVTDGGGFSLNILDASDNGPSRWCDKANWCASKYPGGTPDEDDPGLLKEHSIVINEVLAHSDGYPNDWIELHNTTDSAINIGGWFLSDDEENDTSLMKYEIDTGTVLGAGEYLVLTEDSNFGQASSDPGKNAAFALSEYGETVYLTSSEAGQLTGYREQEDFDASENGVALGRHQKSTGTHNFVAMSSNTPGASFEGAANAYPKVGPVVINEIMYNPASRGQNEEYVELYNITGGTVNLYDSSDIPWKFTDGIKFTFPPGTSIPDHDYILIVKTTPAYFLTKYPSVPGGIQIFGPYEGKLSNNGEKLELSKPGDVDEFDTQHYIRVDRVSYSDGSHPENCGATDPWPVEADGGGSSLTRLYSELYGNDPNNWQAAYPTPGT